MLTAGADAELSAILRRLPIIFQPAIGSTDVGKHGIFAHMAEASAIIEACVAALQERDFDAMVGELIDSSCILAPLLIHSARRAIFCAHWMLAPKTLSGSICRIKGTLHSAAGTWPQPCSCTSNA